MNTYRLSISGLVLIFMAVLSFNLSAKEQKVGEGVLEYSIFKIDLYKVSYYRGPSKQERLVLTYYRDIKREHSQKGWKVGLAPIVKKMGLKESDYSWPLTNTVDAVKGDVLEIEKSGNKVTLSKNGQKYASIDDPLVAKLIFYPWLGDKPIDRSLKSKLLGGKS